MATKPEVKDENEEWVKVEVFDESAKLGDSVLYCIGGKFGYSTTTGRWDHEPHSSISYLSHSLTTPHWTTIDWPHPRIEPATVIHDHKLYIFGGSGPYYTYPGTYKETWTPDRTNSRKYLDTVEVFDLRSKRWLPVHRFPVGMGETSACSLGDYIYFCGGRFTTLTGSFEHFEKLLRYCPISCQLEEKQSPTCIGGAADPHVVLVPGVDARLLSLDGYLYVISAGNMDNGYLSMGRYDPATDQWSSVIRTNYEMERNLLGEPFSAIVHRGKIYAFSKRFGLEVFCFRAGSWTRLAEAVDHEDGECPEWQKKVYGELASINDRLVLVGDRCCKPYFRVFEFDLETAVWIRRTDGNIPRYEFSVQVYNPSV